MTPLHYYSNLIGAAEVRHGKPLSYQRYKSKRGLVVHHILPVSEGGTDEGYNLVYLTPDEHLKAHELLALIHGGMMAHIFISMAHNPAYGADVRQKALAKTLAHSVYKEPSLVEVFTKGRVGRTRKPKRKYRKLTGRKSSTGFYGVYPQPSSKKNPFSAYCQIDKDRVRIGNYPTAREAAIAYDIAAIQLYDANHPRNFPGLSLSELRGLMVKG